MIPIPKDKRFEQLTNLLVKYTRLDFSEKAIVTEKGDEIDAFSAVLNTMVEELTTLLKKEKEQSEEITQLNELLEKKVKYRTEALRKREKLFRAMIEKGSDVIMLRSDQGKLLYLSPSITTVTGFTPNECLNNTANQFDHPDEALELKDWRNKILNSPGESFYKQWRLLHKDGTYRWCEGISTNMLNDTNVNAVVINFRDITERKKSEEKQELFASIVNSTDDAILSKTLDGKITSWNNGAEKIFGYSLKEIIGKNISILIPPHLLEEENEIVKKISRGEFVNHYETERIRKDGKIIIVSLTISPIKDSSGKIIGASKISRDITERKKIENALLISNQETLNYKDALDASCIVAITDQKGIINFVNDNFCRISKYSREELLGQDHRIVNSGDHSKEFIKNIWATIANGKVWKGEIKNKAKDGTHYWVDTTIVPFLGENGKPFQYVAIRSDITERKNSEDELTRLLSRLSQAQEVAHIGSWELNFATGIGIWSDEACRIYGLSPEENKHTQEDWLSFIHPEDVEFVINSAKAIREELSSITIQHRIVTKSGHVKHVITKSKFDFDQTGNPIGLFGICHDVTEIKIIENKIKESEARLKEAQAIAHVSNWEIDLLTNVNIWSDEFYRIFEINKEEIIPSPEAFLSLIHIEDVHYVREIVERTFQTFEGSSFYARVKTKTNDPKYIYCEWKFEFDNNKKPIRMYGILQDTTEQKLAEEKIINSELKIRNFARHLNKVQEEERAHIAREIHDQLGQELVGIKIGLSSFIKNNSFPNENEGSIRNMMGTVDDAIHSLRRIATELRPGILDTLGLSSSIIWLGKEFERKTEIKCRIDVEAIEQQIERDVAICFFRICQEALTNIAKHANPTEVQIILFQTKNELILEVIDNGKGMPGEKLENHFSMGMIGMRERAKNIGGNLVVTSKKNEGTTVRLNTLFN